jgi:hypothetical protein
MQSRCAIAVRAEVAPRWFHCVRRNKASYGHNRAIDCSNTLLLVVNEVQQCKRRIRFECFPQLGGRPISKHLAPHSNSSV